MTLAINYYSISLFLGGFVALLSGIIVFLTDRRSFTNWSWLLLNISSAIWSLGYFSMITSGSKEAGYLSNLILHYGAIFIPFFYLLFILGITKTLKQYSFIPIFSIPLVLFFTYINSTSLFINDVLPKFIFNYAPNAGPLYFYFAAYFFVINTIGCLILFKKINSSKDKREVGQFRQILLSSLAGFIGGGSVFFLTFNISLPPYPIILFTFYPMIIAYAIIRYGLFNVKLIATQLLVFLIWIAIAIRAILSQGFYEKLFSFGLLFATIIIGIFLIRSVIKEVEQREKIQKLAEDLEKANVRLRELDLQKNEFLSFASHQLRAPLTAIKGYSSMLTEGSYGEISDKVKDPISKIFLSSQHLLNLIEDFLNITRIELGKMEYKMEKVDLGAMANDIIGALMPNAQAKKLELSLINDGNGPYNVSVDYEKIRQVVLNLIDNAIKYTPSGFVKVKLSKNNNKVLLTVSDSGLGISPELKDRLFEKFSRGNQVSKMHVNGTGLGLFVAKEMMQAHGGDIRVESQGENRGSTFFVEFKAI